MESNGFNAFKSVEARPFSKDEFQLLVKHTTPNPPPPPSSSLENVDGCASNLAKQLAQLKCSTILIEKNYIDRDYKAEFSAFYSKRFSLPPAFCTRLHFFKSKLPEYGPVTNPSEIDPLLGEESYLGFCVVRPTEFFRIGRTIIKFQPPLNSPYEYYLTCCSWYSTHLFGREFKVYGMPFIQQDTQVGACAHAVLWMVGRYLHALGYCPETSLPQINAFAKSRQSRGRHYPAQDGLVSVQMLDALHEMGLSPIYYDNFRVPEKARSDFIASLVYFYVESGFPVIIALDQHVILAIGHTLDPVSRVHKNIFGPIPSFIIHDDILQPYGEFPLSGNNQYDLQKITELIAILPKSVHLQGEYAEKLALVMIEQLGDRQNQLVKDCEGKAPGTLIIPCNYRLRTYLMKSTEFLAEINVGIREGKVPESIGNMLLRLEFPNYIWVSEFFETFQKSPGRKEDCIGKFIFDSTAAAWDRSVIVVLLEKMAFLFDRQHLEDPPLIQPFSEPWQFIPRNIHSHRVVSADC